LDTKRSFHNKQADTVTICYDAAAAAAADDDDDDDDDDDATYVDVSQQVQDETGQLSEGEHQTSNIDHCMTNCILDLNTNRNHNIMQPHTRFCKFISCNSFYWRASPEKIN